MLLDIPLLVVAMLPHILTCMYVPPTLFCLLGPPAWSPGASFNSPSTNCIPLLWPRGHLCLPLVHFACLGPILIKGKRGHGASSRSARRLVTHLSHTHAHTTRETRLGYLWTPCRLCAVFFSPFYPAASKKPPWNIDRRIPVDGDGAEDYSELFFFLNLPYKW